MRVPDPISWLGRRQLLIGASALAGAATAAQAAKRVPTTTIARFRVKTLSLDPPRFAVTAEVPINGDRLAMTDSYPAELPEMAAGGWPTLVSALTATDSAGSRLTLTPVKDQGWRLAQPVTGRVRLSYVVDFAIFAKAKWPSPLESAVADGDTAAVCARALFITTAAMTGAEVSIDAPARWKIAAPWPASSASPGAYRAATATDLTDNFIAISTRAADVVTAAGFRLQVTAMGHWRPLRPMIRRALQAIIAREVAFMGYQQRESYNVILVPMSDTGGEAYRQSFVYAFTDPTPANRTVWLNTMAHEIFHYWNYARLQGADYASTQWFQEGFTEYVANLTMVGSGLVAPQIFLDKLATHVANARKLTTTLEAIGTHKGPPLYSAGALVAFSFDVMIRRASNSRRNLGDFFRNLWRYTGAGARKYAWADIEAALRGTADADWQDFYARHIRAHDPLPLAAIFAEAGLKLRARADGTPLVTFDPAAKPTAKAVWASLIR